MNAAAMNPYPYLKGFAWIAIIALACSIFTDFWLPMLAGATAIILLLSLLDRRPR